ncbi:MAG: molecular chaperone DnaK, partial [bacterium]|nr:molecular chaperone DnaK [bacterium]
KEFGDKVDDTVKNRIDGSIQRLRQEMEKQDNTAELESAFKELEENLQALGEAVYKAAGGGAACPGGDFAGAPGAGAAPGGAEGGSSGEEVKGSEEGVVDADFEEVKE